MSLQTLPSPYEIAGGDNPYYDAAGNIAGLAGADMPGDYARYLQPSSPLLAGLDEGELFGNWPIATASAAYGYMRTGRSGLGLLLGLIGGYYMPRLTPLAIAFDAVFSHEGVRMTMSRYARR